MATTRIEAIVSPTTPLIAKPMRLFDAAKDVATYSTHCYLANLLGAPAITIPCGFSPDGLPIGLQFMGRAMDERRLLIIARLFELSRSPVIDEALLARRAATPGVSLARSQP
jgi:Asp-tRNA(Asn)/Glu-tRNA(Gln) amidotransferase A subunit family amidase